MITKYHEQYGLSKKWFSEIVNFSSILCSRVKADSPTNQFQSAGVFFLHKVINSMSFRLSTFPSQTLHKKKLRTYVLLECIRALQNPKGFKLHLQKPPLTYVLGNHGQFQLTKYFTLQQQIITILCPWVLRPMHSEIFSSFRNQDCNNGVALILCYT